MHAFYVISRLQKGPKFSHLIIQHCKSHYGSDHTGCTTCEKTVGTKTRGPYVIVRIRRFEKLSFLILFILLA